jgi:2-polyprenyl-6-methoxyphenol hydroxylase-like FAD-dependent oxidoreductase
LTDVREALVVGGGPAGMAAAIGLRKLGARVQIAEIDPSWSASGIGLTLLGPTLRALSALGVVERCVDAGFPLEELRVLNARGEITGGVDFPRLDRADPAAVGIARPAFHRVLADATLAAGVDVRLGTTVTSLQERDDALEVEFSDGSRGFYDLVLGADGLHSKVRELVLESPSAPQFTGQAVWRTLMPRPPELDVYHMFYGRRAKIGFVPVSTEDLYMFVVENVPDMTRPPREDRVERLRGLLDADSELVEYAKGQIVEPDYRPLEWLLVPAPWHRGRVVLLGDAVHTTTPHLAFGAAIAVEDATVLCELLAELPVDEAIERYTPRRFERCRLVVENSVQLGEWERNPSAPGADPVRLTRESWATLIQRP